MTEAVRIENLRAFRAALKAAQDATPRELSTAIRQVGKPIVARASALAPHRTGTLAKGYAARASGTTGRIVNRAPYAGGAEWGMHRKWSGFKKYGPRGQRFAGRALEELREPTARAIAERLEQIINIHGWARR